MNTQVDPQGCSISSQIFDWDLSFQGDSSACEPQIKVAIDAWKTRRWSDFQTHAESVFASRNNREERAYWLFMLVSSAEIQYDLKLCEKYFSKWSSIHAWSGSAYCRHLHSYSQGLMAFFSCHLNEAERLLSISLYEAQEADYIRGEIRCHFHLGLVERDRLQILPARQHFTLARQKADLLAWTLYSRRSQIQLVSLDHAGFQVVETDPELALLQEKILLQDFIFARRLYLKLNRTRVREGIQKESDNLAVYLPLLLNGLGHFRLSNAALRLLHDRIMRIQYFMLKARVFTLSDAEVTELDFLNRSQGRSEAVSSPLLDSHRVSIAGIDLERIKSEDLRSALQLLLRSPEGATKEALHQAVWNFSYDPILHDARIYKMMARLKKLLGRPDSVLNDYGRYRLNPALLGKAQLR